MGLLRACPAPLALNRAPSSWGARTNDAAPGSCVARAQPPGRVLPTHNTHPPAAAEAACERAFDPDPSVNDAENITTFTRQAFGVLDYVRGVHLLVGGGGELACVPRRPLRPRGWGCSFWVLLHVR